jgi:ribosomal protein S18 acetylase RimI-like enzyme
MTAHLRPAVDDDLLAVGALHYRSRASAYSDLLSPAALSFGSPAALGEWWTERWRWERDTHRLTVAVDGGLRTDLRRAGDELVGFSYLGPSPEDGVRELYAIHVDPTAVGTGVGKLLMLDALPHLGDHAVLWVLAENAVARRFYEQGGWSADGTTRDEAMGGEMTHQLRYTCKV